MMLVSSAVKDTPREFWISFDWRVCRMSVFFAKCSILMGRWHGAMN
jgi:hypothetical protein